MKIISELLSFQQGESDKRFSADDSTTVYRSD
jgi:hypothetical protein